MSPMLCQEIEEGKIPESSTSENSKDITKIDARIISFNPCGLSSQNSDIAFSYFSQSAVKEDSAVKEQSDTKESNVNKCHLLQKAYETAMSRNSSNNNNRFLIAFTDIVKEKKNDLDLTQEEINDFWEKNDSKLLFLTMINLKQSSGIEACIDFINKIFYGSKYLIYFTFDHCDLLVFCRKNSFEEYASLIKRLTSKDLVSKDSTSKEPTSNDTVIANVYSFFQLKKLDNVDKETTCKSHALVRLKIDDSNQANNFWNKIKCNIPEVKRQIFFDHFNCGFYLNDDILNCLSKISDTINQYEHELIVSVDDDNDDSSCKNQIDDDSSCKNHTNDNFVKKEEIINNAFKRFDKLFRDVYQNLKLFFPSNNHSSINVWLRWLESSLNYAVSLMNNPISRNIGMCLVPQYLDLLEYGIKFYGKIDKDGKMNKNKKGKMKKVWGYNDNIEKMAQSMFIFFSDIAILVDSMNCGYRQFSQLPSYHFPSFEVPSKIMEYYIAVAHELMFLFREDEDKETIYSILITPQFIDHLGVTSIADQRVLENDQWLEIVIGESSFYTLQLTTQTLGHEISHFVGQKTRCREKRKEFVLEYAYCLLINLVRKKIKEKLKNEPFNDVLELVGKQKGKQISLNDVEPDQIIQTAEKMFKIAQETIPQYNTKSENRMIDLESCIYLLVNYVTENPCIYQILLEHIVNSVNYSSKDPLLKRSMELSIGEILYQNLSELTVDYSNDNVVIKDKQSSFEDLNSLFKSALGYFKETFADLQAIMTFDMKWEHYCKLISRGGEIPGDCPLRMLAVAQTLYSRNEPSWINITEESLENNSNLESDHDLEDIKKAINLSPTQNVVELQELKFNAILLHYLTSYLNECYTLIKSEFVTERCVNRRVRLQRIHKTLEDGTALEVQNQISLFVEEYQNSLYNRFAEPANPEGSVFNL